MFCGAHFRRQLADISTPPPTAGIQRSVSIAADEEDLVDPREVDKVVSEAAGMSSRWGLFRKFMHDRLKVASRISTLAEIRC